MSNYVKSIPGRSGYYFQRAVPRQLQDKIGKKTWIWKAGDSLEEARRKLAEYLIETDALIANAKGEVTMALVQHLDASVKRGEQLPDDVHPDDLFPRHSVDDQQRLFDRLQALSKGEQPTGRTPAELV